MGKYKWLVKSYLIIAFWEGIKHYSPKIVQTLDDFLKKLNKKQNTAK